MQRLRILSNGQTDATSVNLDITLLLSIREVDILLEFVDHLSFEVSWSLVVLRDWLEVDDEPVSRIHYQRLV